MWFPISAIAGMTDAGLCVIFQWSSYSGRLLQWTEMTVKGLDSLTHLNPTVVNRTPRSYRSRHSSDKRFVCHFPNCQRRFYEKFNLNRHIRINHGVDPDDLAYPDAKRVQQLQPKIPAMLPSGSDLAGVADKALHQEDRTPVAKPVVASCEIRQPLGSSDNSSTCVTNARPSPLANSLDLSADPEDSIESHQQRSSDSDEGINGYSAKLGSRDLCDYNAR